MRLACQRPWTGRARPPSDSVPEQCRYGGVAWVHVPMAPTPGCRTWSHRRWPTPRASCPPRSPDTRRRGAVRFPSSMPARSRRRGRHHRARDEAAIGSNGVPAHTVQRRRRPPRREEQDMCSPLGLARHHREGATGRCRPPRQGHERDPVGESAGNGERPATQQTPRRHTSQGRDRTAMVAVSRAGPRRLGATIDVNRHTRHDCGRDQSHPDGGGRVGPHMPPGSPECRDA